MRNANPALTAAYKASLAHVAPNLTAKPVKGVFGSGSVPPFEVVASQGGFKAWAELSDSQGPGNLFIYLEKMDFSEVSARFANGCSQVNAGMACTTRRGPGGELIWIEQGHPGGAAITRYAVSVAKPDGSSLDAILDNYSENDQPHARDPHPQRPTPPLSVEETIALLLGPGLTAP
jgi:hypothetical protein